MTAREAAMQAADEAWEAYEAAHLRYKAAPSDENYDTWQEATDAALGALRLLRLTAS